MQIPILNQKRKVLFAFEETSKNIIQAYGKLASNDFNQAQALFDQSINLLDSEICRKMVADDVLTSNKWKKEYTEALLGKAKTLFALEKHSGAYHQAERLLNEGFKIRNEWLEGHELMAQYALAIGFGKEAREHIKRILSIDPNYNNAVHLMAVADFECGGYQEAVKKFSTLPESSNTLCYTARCYLKVGDFDSGITLLERAEARFGENYEINYFLGCAYGWSGRFDDARRILGQLIRWVPRRPEPLIQLGNVCLMSGWYEEAERFYKEALKYNLQNVETIFYGLATICLLTNRVFEFTDYQQKIEVNKNATDLNYCLLAAQMELNNDLEKSLMQYELVQSVELLGIVKLRMGLLQFKLRNYPAALWSLKQSSQYHPNDKHLIKMLGAAAIFSGEYAEAIKYWGRLSEEDGIPNEAFKNAFQGLIQQLITRRLIDEAILWLENYIEKNKDEDISKKLAEICFTYAIDLLSQKQPDFEKIKKLLNTGKFITNNLKYDYGLSLVDLKQKDYAIAVERLRFILAANSINPGASYHLGLALYLADEVTAAENVLRHGVAVAYKQPKKSGRLKIALAYVLMVQKRYNKAIITLDELLTGEEKQPTAIIETALDLKIRCLALSGKWEAAERLAVKLLPHRQFETANVILGKRCLEMGDYFAGFLLIESCLIKSQPDSFASLGLNKKMQDALAQLAVKIAVTNILNQRLDDAKSIIERTLALIDQTNDIEKPLRVFYKALEMDDRQVIKNLADIYKDVPVKLELQADDFTPSDKYIPIVLPAKLPSIENIIEAPKFNPADWDASPYPNPMVFFDR
ncbi:MAG: tetratricopeptide repeat protein [Acidobacteriota bacterium]